ncbi:hypothetical protein [Streptomonospora litoralis]|uniref:Uncharacterized protein n=1 Tax=Streptomonospora litoralis TaxID=2498135 RepID=A0A4P6Q3I8_9ACTN|nr:hypothetical protein [Streptomonospora litoralis]QBI53459.1 hypothetical protein EKD16_08325 [Streptomonospora litoralis]
MVLVMMTRCEPCMLDYCPTPHGPHTWMGPEDAEHAGLPWPLPDDEAAARPCACECAGGPGGCVAMPIPPGLTAALEARLNRDREEG